MAVVVVGVNMARKVQERVERFVLFIPARLVRSHQLVQGIYKCTSILKPKTAQLKITLLLKTTFFKRLVQSQHTGNLFCVLKDPY